MRVKNEATYIGHALESLQPLGGEIVLLDDGSTDSTPDIVRGFGNVHYHRQDDMPMDEGRDRTALYRWALELDPDWIFTLDGDEVLCRMTPRRMKAAMEYAPEHVSVFKMFLAVMASPVGSDPPQKRWYRGGSPFGYWDHDRLFRVSDADRDHEFTGRGDGNLHCGCVPAIRDGGGYTEARRLGENRIQRLNAWIEYYGYESPEAIAKKRAFYKEHDPLRYPNVEQRLATRLKNGPCGFPNRIDCREIGITKTVSY
jgi:glycosyltransferase involved in cell wall biosynthesis